MKYITIIFILSFSFMAKASFIPFDEIPSNQIQAQHQPAKAILVQSISTNLHRVKFVLTGQNLSESNFSVQDHNMREKYKNFINDIVWLKRNASKTYSSHYYPAYIVEHEFNLILKKVDQLKAELVQYDEIHLRRNSEIAFMMDIMAVQYIEKSFKTIIKKAQKLEKTMIQAKKHRQMLEPYFSI